MTTIEDVKRAEAIQSYERQTFQCLFDNDYTDRLALVRCYLDGVPTTTVCLVDHNPVDGDFMLTPLYIGVTDQMDLRGPDGQVMQPMIKN